MGGKQPDEWVSGTPGLASWQARPRWSEGWDLGCSEKEGTREPLGCSYVPPKGALGGFQPGVIVSSLHILSDGIGLDQLS